MAESRISKPKIVITFIFIIIAANAGTVWAHVGIPCITCSSCHIVGKTASGVVKADVPSFTSIANSPDQSADRLKARLIVPHQPTPDLQLTVTEIRDLIAYILSLRGQ